MARRWYAVQAKTGQETLAELNLRRQSYETFLPCSYRTIRHARQIRTVRSAFFPGYLFAAFDPDAARWRSIDGTIGVLRLLKADDSPLPAPKGLVEALIAATKEDGALDLAGALAPGAAVRVICGPFADQLAVVEKMSGPDRVRVLLSIMNQKVPLEVRRSALAAV
jgi:transcriptional antiterminator RfaH